MIFFRISLGDGCGSHRNMATCKRGLLMMFSLIRSLLLHQRMIDLLMRRIWLESFAIKKGTKQNLILWNIWNLLFQSTHSSLGLKILSIPHGILRCRGRLQVMWLSRIEFNALENIKFSRMMHWLRWDYDKRSIVVL